MARGQSNWDARSLAPATTGVNEKMDSSRENRGFVRCC